MMSEPINEYDPAEAPDAVAYDAWFREQVQAAIGEAESAGAVWYSQEEVEAEFAQRRAKTHKRLAGQA